jgi:hypothetical protein
LLENNNLSPKIPLKRTKPHKAKYERNQRKDGFSTERMSREKEKEQLQKETKSSTESHVIEKSDIDG